MKCLCGLQNINMNTTGNSFIYPCDKINLKSAYVGGNKALGEFVFLKLLQRLQKAFSCN